MFINVIASEWIKLRTTKAFWWTSFVAALMGLMVAFISTWYERSYGNPVRTPPPFLLSFGVQNFSLLIIAVQAIMLFTTENRFGVQQQTYLGTPLRWVSLIARWLLYAVVSALLVLVTLIVCFLLPKLILSGTDAVVINFWKDDQAMKLLWKLPVVTALTVTFAFGIATLVRQTAGAITVYLIWQFVLESQFSAMIPRVGKWIGKYGPFSNLTAFLNEQWVIDPGWSFTTAGLYFGLWGLVLLILGVVLVERRDA